MKRKLRYGMVGGGQGAFIGAVHRMAANLDGQIELVAGCFSSDPKNSRTTGEQLFLNPKRVYASYTEMAEREAALPADSGLILSPSSRRTICTRRSRPRFSKGLSCRLRQAADADAQGGEGVARLFAWALICPIRSRGRGRRRRLFAGQGDPRLPHLPFDPLERHRCHQQMFDAVRRQRPDIEFVEPHTLLDLLRRRLLEQRAAVPLKSTRDPVNKVPSPQQKWSTWQVVSYSDLFLVAIVGIRRFLMPPPCGLSIYHAPAGLAPAGAKDW